VRALDRVRAVHQDLGLDDRDEPFVHAERGVARERVGIGAQAVVARQRVGDRDHGAPLGEARAEAAVLDEPLAEAVETLGNHLVRGERQRLGALVDLDAGDDALVGEELRERRTVARLLPDRLVEEDHAADVVLAASSW
jgi:hypothetical protein